MSLRIKRTKRRNVYMIFLRSLRIGFTKKREREREKEREKERETGSGYRTVMIILPYKITILRYTRGA